MVVEKWAKAIALKIKRMDPDGTKSVEVMTHGLIVILNTAITLGLITLFGLITGKLQDTFIAMLSFAVLRQFSGGFHFKSAMMCSIFSATIFAIIPLIQIATFGVYVINLMCSILILLWAPSSIEKQSLIPKQYYPFLRIISLIVVSINFIIVSDIVAMSFLFQSLLLIRIERR